MQDAGEPGLPGVGVTLTGNNVTKETSTDANGNNLFRGLQAGATTVTITRMTLTWPASNGTLNKVKLDGDVVWDKKSPRA